MKRILVAAVAALGMFGCDKPSAEGFNIPGPKDLKPGGVYVAYNHGCDKGCDQVDKGDLIQKVDGKTVKTGEEVDAVNLVDGKPHKLELLAAGSLAPKSVEVVAKPKTDMPPLANVPPFWLAGAEELNLAPEWA